MARRNTILRRCPTCGKAVLQRDEDFPFCGDRCRVIDLGKWASGEYVISSPLNDPESGGEAEYNEPAARRSGIRKPGSGDGDPSAKPN